jgi:hypothetical protein
MQAARAARAPRLSARRRAARHRASKVAAIRLSKPRFGLLCILGYVALSWAVRFDMRLGQQIASLLYPLDTFSMYAGMPGEDRSHLLVRDRQGTVHRVTTYRSFDCAEPISGADTPCATRRGIPYIDEDLTRYIRAHRGGGDEEVELITRTWELRPGAPPAREPDCVIARCKASR